jgi:hypothetical protein
MRGRECIRQTEQVGKAGEKSEKRNAVFRLADQIAHTPFSHPEVVRRLLEIQAELPAEADAERDVSRSMSTIVVGRCEVDRDLVDRFADQRELPRRGSREWIESDEDRIVGGHHILCGASERSAHRRRELHRSYRQFFDDTIAESDQHARVPQRLQDRSCHDAPRFAQRHQSS